MSFKPLNGDTVILVQHGLYRQADLYEWDGKLFAKLGSGYVRLRMNGTTSKDGVLMEHMEIETPLFTDKFGRLTITQHDGYKPFQIEDLT